MPLDAEMLTRMSIQKALETIRDSLATVANEATLFIDGAGNCIIRVGAERASRGMISLADAACDLEPATRPHSVA